MGPDSQMPTWQARVLSLFRRYVAFAERRTGWLLLAAITLAAVSLLFALRLELHTDLVELLPDDHPAVQALRRISGRQISSTNLVLIIESPDPAQNRRFAEALRPALNGMIPKVFSEIQWQPETEVPEYASKWQWLYASREDLASAEELLDRVIARRSSPLVVDLDGNPEDELKELRKSLQKKLPVANHSPYFEAKDKTKDIHYLGIMLWRRGDGLASLGAHQTLEAVQEVVRHTRPETFHPKMEVEYSGHIAMAIDQHNAVRDDLTLATGVCVSLVLLVIYLYFRRTAVLFVVGAPAILGVLSALMLAYFTIHFLNANTAFLISIILGNGINTPIILLARYGEERRHGHPVSEALSQAMAATLLATVVATAAASISYASLLCTTLRGLNQFGLVGGSGILLVWLFSFLLVPPMVLLGERLRDGLLTPAPNLSRGTFLWLARLAVHRPLAMALLSVALLAVAFVPAYRYARDPLEYNFNNLLTKDPNASRRWEIMYLLDLGNVGAGYIGRDGVLLVDTPEQADPVAKALWEQELARGDKRILQSVRTLHTILPQDQEAKLKILEHIRNKIDRHRDMMSEDELKEVSEWRPPDYLRPIGVPDLPRRLRENFTEVDGTMGRLIGIDADPKRYGEGDGRELIRLSKSLKVDALGRTWVAAATATVFAGMLETIIEDGPKVTLVALVGVVLLISLAFGRAGAPLVLGTVGIGLVWLAGLLGVLQLKLNFINFVALSITLGVGADYAANIWARAVVERVDDHPERLARVIADTGSAVALCSLTTIIGYSSLLLARNRALQSFGQIADLGELTCLLAALTALPVLIRYRRRKAAPAGKL